MNVPFPEVVQSTLEWFVAVPDKVCVLPWQTVASSPAFEVGDFCTVRIIASDAATMHGEMAEAVSVSVTLLISVLPGV